MILPALSMGAFLFGLLAPSYQPATTKVYGEDGWMLRVVTDNFTRQTTCVLGNRQGRRPDVTVERGVIAFHFSPRIDTSKAWYAVDGGSPKAWRDLDAQLVQTGEMAQAEQLDNATGGVVLIPVTDVEGAAAVTIQPERRAAPRTVSLKQLWPIAAAAQRLGCNIGRGVDRKRPLSSASNEGGAESSR